MKSGNLYFQAKYYNELEYRAIDSELKLTVFRISVFLFLLVGGSMLVAGLLFHYPIFKWATSILPYISLVGTVVLPLLMLFNMRWAKYIAPIYSICEGLFLGFLSSLLEKFFPGVFLVPLVCPLIVFVIVFCLFRMSNFFRTSQLLTKIFSTLIMTLLFLNAIDFLILSIIGESKIYSGGVIGIVLNVTTLVAASLSFVFDFRFIEEVNRRKLSDNHQWFAAMGLIVTFTWLYFAVLNLIFSDGD